MNDTMNKDVADPVEESLEDTLPEHDPSQVNALDHALLDDFQQLKNILDAALAVSEDPLTIQKMQSMFPEEARPAREVIEEVLGLLRADCELRGVELKQIGNSYRYQSKESYAPWIRRLYQQKTPRYSRAVLETLAIIAYRQPVTRSDIEEIRGVSVSSEIIKTLLTRQWIKEVGKKEVPGRPSLYGSTAEFLAYFNLQKLADLPPLSQMREFEEIAKEHKFDFLIPEAEDEPIDDATDVDSDDIPEVEKVYEKDELSVESEEFEVTENKVDAENHQGDDDSFTESNKLVD